jgi:uncharacterized membrane protein
MVFQSPDAYVQQRLRVERWLSVILLITALDTMYLSWRFVGLFGGWSQPGTGLCSWSERIDCDKVLQTPEARAFYVPNAILRMAFYTGCLWWWFLGRKLGIGYLPHLIRSLIVWLGVASLLTIWFWRLLFRLDALCPVCPWNHVLSYVALGLAIRVWQLTPHPPVVLPLRPLLYLVAFCVGWFWIWQLGWIVAEQSGLFAGPRVCAVSVFRFLAPGAMLSRIPINEIAAWNTEAKACVLLQTFGGAELRTMFQERIG